VERNGLVTLNGGEYIADRGFAGAHHLLDMVLIRDVPADHFTVKGDRVNDSSFGIDAGDCPDLLTVCLIKAADGFSAGLIQVDDMARFRQDGQDARPVDEEVFDSPGGLPGMKRLLDSEVMNPPPAWPPDKRG